MKAIITSMVVTAGLMVAGSAMAADMPELAKKSGCTACHAIDKKVVGPAWAEVGKKYAGDAKAEAMLVEKVAKGGKGTWGQVAMPANSPKVSDADIKELVKFILTLK
jgi:cytochrome c